MLVLDDGRVLVGEDTGKHENNMVWLCGEANSVPVSKENITVNEVRAVSTSTDNTTPWGYQYQAEVSQLRSGLTYTAIVLVNTMDGEEMTSMWVWNGIESSGEQYDRTFSLKPGCYAIETSLYERDDFNLDAGNATVLSTTSEDLVVGLGTCSDGQYIENTPVNNTADETNTEPAKEDDGALPGFGVSLSLCAALGALLFSNRKRH